MSLIPRIEKKYDPFEDLTRLGDSLFGLTLFPQIKNLPGFERGWSPAIDVVEDKDKITVTADLPGLKQEEIDVSLEDDMLTIRGERKSENEQKDKNYHRIERFYGRFERSLPIGPDVDREKITATYKNGVLEVVLPKTERARPKQLKINVK